MTATGTKGQLHFDSIEKRTIPVMAILQAGAAIGGTLIKGINVLVDAKRAKSFNNAIKMVTVNVELTHQRLITLENRTSMMEKAILQRVHHQYNRYESALDDTLIGIESLSSGYSTHHILDTKTLSRYLEAIVDDMEGTAPDHEPVFTNIYQYYGNSLASLIQ